MKKIILDQKDRVALWVKTQIAPNANLEALEFLDVSETKRCHSTVTQEIMWNGFWAIGLEENGKLIAGVVIDGYVKDARCAMHVAGIGKHWLNRAYLHCCFDYVFRQLNCKTVIGLVNADNSAALRFDKHLGFTETTRIKDGAGDCDLVVLEMRRENCRFLNL